MTTPNYIVFRELFKWAPETKQIATYDDKWTDEEGSVDPDKAVIVPTTEFLTWVQDNIRGGWELQIKDYSVFYLKFNFVDDAVKFLHDYKGQG